MGQDKTKDRHRKSLRFPEGLRALTFGLFPPLSLARMGQNKKSDHLGPPPGSLRFPDEIRALTFGLFPFMIFWDWDKTKNLTTFDHQLTTWTSLRFPDEIRALTFGLLPFMILGIGTKQKI
jgi:hypothetical protein